MVDFGGWDMPLQYSGILEEHRAVRSAAGLFDVSHMGEIEIQGADAAALTDYVTTNAVAKLQPGQAQYSGLLYQHARLRRRHFGAQDRKRSLLSVRQRVESAEGLPAHRRASISFTPPSI